MMFEGTETRRVAVMSSSADVEMLQRACDLSDRILSGVQSVQFTDPTPCREWDVRALMEHQVASTDFFADAAEHGSVPDDREWPDYTEAELVPAFRQHADRLLTAFRSPGVMDRSMEILAGPPTATFCLQIALSERFVHSWDLAKATGQRFGQADQDIAEALLASDDYVSVNSQVRANIPPPIGPRLVVGSSASAVDRLVAFLGRDPAWTAG
jgi:uncharacterized protein (TIGR03086 family)